MKNKGVYISLGLVVAAVVYFWASKKKGKGSTGNQNENSEGGGGGGQKTQPSVTEMIKNKTIIGKNIKSQVDGVRLRISSYVNDGMANNRYGEVPEANTEIGRVKYVTPDQTGATNPVTKTTYNWLGVEITDAVYDEIQKNQRNILTRDLWPNKRVPLWVREDVIKL